MDSWDRILFNLFFNATTSFLVAVLIVVACINIFRINASYWKLYFLSLPFVKIIWDFLRGIPENSFIYTGLNPLTMPPLHGSLKVGAGISDWGPIISVIFSMKDLSQHEYPISIADLLAALISKHIAANAVQIISVIFLSVSVYLIFRRLLTYFKFEILRRADRRKLSSEKIKTIKIDLRKIDVYKSSSYSGTPFTGRIFSPYICIPKDTYNLLTDEELQAVIQHELAHIKYFDMLTTFMIKLLGDIFWFVPGYKFLSRKIDNLREVLADKVSFSLNLSNHLASALVKIGESKVNFTKGVLYSALFREKSLLKERIARLISVFSGEKEPRFFWRLLGVRIFVAIWLTGTVFVATLGGNEGAYPIPSFISKYVIETLRWLGLI